MKVVSRRGAIQLLGRYRDVLTRQQIKTLKGQTENDPEGCVKGLKKLSFGRQINAQKRTMLPTRLQRYNLFLDWQPLWDIFLTTHTATSGKMEFYFAFIIYKLKQINTFSPFLLYLCVADIMQPATMTATLPTTLQLHQ